MRKGLQLSFNVNFISKGHSEGGTLAYVESKVDIFDLIEPELCVKNPEFTQIDCV